ncbi:MAG: nitroreductase family protein [Promethearchaeota archaeon]|nr:MAG: nitroreductase family protein [Candidatus Lokiarchaeota archaeon]
MDFYEVVKTRRSFRVYKPEMPEKEKVERVLEAARLAPTWANKQGVQYIIVKEPDNVKSVWKAIEQETKFTNAPMFIVGLISPYGSGVNKSGEKYYGVDFGICFEHLILAATAEGLATCWIGWFNEKKLKEILQIPKNYKIMGLTPLGYPIKPKGEVVDRKLLDEIVHYEQF